MALITFAIIPPTRRAGIEVCSAGRRAAVGTRRCACGEHIAPEAQSRMMHELTVAAASLSRAVRGCESAPGTDAAR